MRWLVGLLAASMLMLSGTAAASAPPIKYIYNRDQILCGVQSGGVVTCLHQDARGVHGYAVGISRDKVMVMRFDRDGSHHVVFRRHQP